MYYDEGNVVYKILAVGIDQSRRKAAAGGIPGVTILPTGDLQQPIVYGAIHRTNTPLRSARGFNEEDILDFDIMEEFGIVAYPRSCPHGCFCSNFHRVSVDEVGGYLNFLRLDADSSSFDVWGLKNYRNGVWVKECRVLPSFDPWELRHGCVRMLRMDEAGEELLAVVRSRGCYLLGSYHPSKGTIINFRYEDLEQENFTCVVS